MIRCLLVCHNIYVCHYNYSAAYVISYANSARRKLLKKKSYTFAIITVSCGRPCCFVIAKRCVFFFKIYLTLLFHCFSLVSIPCRQRIRFTNISIKNRSIAHFPGLLTVRPRLPREFMSTCAHAGEQ